MDCQRLGREFLQELITEIPNTGTGVEHQDVTIAADFNT
jgi:hypothetical protein